MAEKLAEAKSIIRKRILGMPEVSSISYDVEEEKIVITVTSEEAKERVREEIPDVIGGYRTEIKIMPKQRLFVEDILATRECPWEVEDSRHLKHRPVPGGVSASYDHPSYSWFGTNAVSTAKDREGNPVFLSNAHVYTSIVPALFYRGKKNYGNVGDQVDQPGTGHQGFGEENFKCGELRNWAEMKEGMVYSDSATALATAEPSEVVIGEEERWKITRAVKVEKGLKVKKSGARTGVTHGKITRTKVDAPAQYRGKTLWTALDQFRMDMPSCGGDSGSLVVTEEGEKAVGILWGGGGGGSIASPIGYVMQDLNIRFPDTPEPPETHPPITPPPPPGPNYKLLGGVGMVGLAAFSMFNAGATGREPFRW